MPAHEQEETSVEILNKWESVGLSDEGTFKYVLIEAYATEKLEGTNYYLLLIVIVNLLLEAKFITRTEPKFILHTF